MKEKLSKCITNKSKSYLYKGLIMPILCWVKIPIYVYYIGIGWKTLKWPMVLNFPNTKALPHQHNVNKMLAPHNLLHILQCILLHLHNYHIGLLQSSKMCNMIYYDIYTISCNPMACVTCIACPPMCNL
jgi:hypothetical protein